MKNDIYEPQVLSKIMDNFDTTFNVMSQGSMIMARSEPHELLHCVSSGAGETLQLVSPYQRVGIKAG